MAVLFLDSSAMVKRYVAEAGSGWVGSLLAPEAGNLLFAAVVSGAEVVSAVVRRQRTGSLSAQDTTRILGEFRDDWATIYETIAVNRMVVDRAMTLAERYGLRGYDAVQLASAMEVNSIAQETESPIVFITADDALSNAASAEGLSVDNPNTHL